MSADPPEGWRACTLSAIAEVVMGQSPPGPTVVAWDGQSRDATGLPFVQGTAEFGPRSPVPVKWCRQPAKVAQTGDALISVRAPVGETNLTDQTLAIGRGLACIRFTTACPAFGWHALNRAKRELERVSQGSTFDAIGSTELRSLAIPLPPLPEQRAIAVVLDAIDDAIKQTEAVITATETLRKALLQRLLTNGVPAWHNEWKYVP